MSGSRPIDCEDVLRHLLAYLDGEVEDHLHEEISGHLERCRGCFSRAQFETRLREHLRQLGRAAVPPEVERRIQSVLDTLPER